MLVIMMFGRSVWLVEYDEREDYSKAICRVGDLDDLPFMKQETKLYSEISKLYGMRIKDLPEDKKADLVGLKVKTPKGVVGYFNQSGNCVIFLSSIPDVSMVVESKKDENRLYPQIVEKDEDILEWEVIDVEKNDIKCNCQVLTGHRHIVNFDTKLEL
jgi:hypothetical protein